MVQIIPALWLRSQSRKIAITAAVLIGTAIYLLAANDSAADLKAGATALDEKRYAAAIASLEPLPKRLPTIADYPAWLLASAQFASKNYAAVPSALAPVWKQTPPSPLAARAYVLAAQADVLNNKPKDAVEILRKNYATLPQPQGDLGLANAFDAAGDSVSAAIYAQRVYYGFPFSNEATQSDALIAKLRDRLGDTYPPALPHAMLGRALKLLEGKEIVRARKELDALIPQLGGSERDLARVRIGVADYNDKQTAPARQYLSSLENLSPEADAERLYYLLQCARRLKNEEEADATLDKLGRLYPNSPWRLQGLVAVADHYLASNQMETYEPLYRACYESFPKDPAAADCHWKMTWGHYLRRRADAGDLLRAHLRLFPGSESASASLYFLGRLAESATDSTAARTYYNEIVREYPNQYYATQARTRLTQIGANGAQSPAVTDFLHNTPFPTRSRTLNFTVGSLAASRIARARLLANAGLKDFAESELRFAAKNEDQPQLMAMELATLITSTKPDQAMHYIKSYASGYLFVPLDSAPRQFWTMAFPLPYREELERFSKQNGLDPFLVAALIRQESEFDPKAVSPSDARGLTQIMPATGKELGRRLKIPAYTTQKLFTPTVNLQLGTFYLKSLTNSVGGKVEAALAAYDGGLTRAKAWLTWGDFREPAEFIETVPFTETHSYVQGVLRNADVYRRLYADPSR
ncbi:MAG TPA: transglycosylase SLT domain-containing protein [Bryobacteraceae bacterium]